MALDLDVDSEGNPWIVAVKEGNPVMMWNLEAREWINKGKSYATRVRTGPKGVIFATI